MWERGKGSSVWKRLDWAVLLSWGWRWDDWTGPASEQGREPKMAAAGPPAEGTETLYATAA